MVPANDHRVLYLINVLSFFLNINPLNVSAHHILWWSWDTFLYLRTINWLESRDPFEWSLWDSDFHSLMTETQLHLCARLFLCFLLFFNEIINIWNNIKWAPGRWCQQILELGCYSFEVLPEFAKKTFAFIIWPASLLEIVVLISI